MHNQRRCDRIVLDVQAALPNAVVSEMRTELKPEYQFVIEMDPDAPIALKSFDELERRHRGLKFELDTGKGIILMYVEKQYTVRFPGWVLGLILAACAAAAAVNTHFYLRE